MVKKPNVIEVIGVVIEALPSANFKVKYEDNIILCRISGKIRINNITIAVEDSVIVELSPYDLTKGRIVRRL